MAVTSDYQILKSRDAGELEMRVNQYIENGFTLAGGLAVAVEIYPELPPRFNFCQAVIKTTTIEDKPDPDDPKDPTDPEEPGKEDPSVDPENPGNIGTDDSAHISNEAK